VNSLWRSKQDPVSGIVSTQYTVRYGYLFPLNSVFISLWSSLYASETWTLTVADSKSLDAFHMKCQRRILGISGINSCAMKRLPLSPVFPPCRTPSVADVQPYWSHSKARRGSACPQGAPHLHQPISWTSTGPFLEASSWSSTWQVDRPAPKR